MQAHALAHAILKTNEGLPVPLTDVSASGKLDGLLFEMTVEQRYRNGSSKPIESVYTFPLPLNAVLLAFELELNGATHVARAFGKQQAERKYESAIDDGNSAALLVDNGNGLFTVNVANLLPGESAVVRYRYAELLNAHKEHVRLSIPTAIAPRYGDPADAKLGGPAVPGTDLFAEYPFRLRIELAGFADATKVHSPSHAIATKASEAGLSVEIARNGFLDRDFVLLLDGADARARATVGPDDQEFMALASAVVEPKSGDDRPVVAKILLDCSGSMAGDSIEAAKRALATLLDGMRSADHFSLSQFGTSVVHVTEGLEPGNAYTLEPLKLVVARIAANLGGTEMEKAVRAAIAIPAPEGSAPDLVLITDGEVYAVDGVVETAVQSGHRLFVVAIGAAPNEALARKISERTGGACDFVAAGEAVEPAILRMFGRLRAVQREVAQVQWPTEPLWTTPLPRAVFPNETLHVMAGFRTRPTAPIKITIAAEEGADDELTLPIPVQMMSNDTLARVAAARRLPSLPEAEAKALAVRYQLCSAHTSLVLVVERAEEVKAGDLPATVSVPQMMVAGWGGASRIAMAGGAPMLSKRARSLASPAPAGAAPTLDYLGGVGDCFEGELTRGPASKSKKEVAPPADIGTEFVREIDKVRAELLGAVAAHLRARGSLPASVEELEKLCALPPLLPAVLNRIIALLRLSPMVVIRAFLELLDRDEGLVGFPAADAKATRQIREARQSLKKYL